MKIARKTIPVFAVGEDFIIGAIDCGSRALVLGEIGKGTIITYILGIVKPENSELLVEESEWSTASSEKEKLLSLALEAIGNRKEYFFDEYLRLEGTMVGYKNVNRDDIKAGDIVIGPGGRCIGVYMGDGSVVVPDKLNSMCRLDVRKLKKTQFARSMHPDFSGEDTVVFTRRLKNVSGYMEGDDIRVAQKELAELGLFSGKLNGRFDIKMIWVVKKFQKKNGLCVDGTIDYAAWKLLGGGVS